MTAAGRFPSDSSSAPIRPEQISWNHLVRYDGKALAEGGVGKAFVEADEFERGGVTFGGDERCGELEGVTRTQRMDAEQATRGASD